MDHDDGSTTSGNDAQQLMWQQLDDELEPLIKGGALRQAIERLSAALETMGEGEETRHIRARLLARRGECLLDLDDGYAALNDARRAIELGETGPATYGLAGWASYHLDKTGAAKEYFDAALSETPDEVTLLTGRALVLMEIEEFDHARADLTHALHQEGKTPELLSLRGETHMRLGDIKAASRDLRAAVEQAPEEAEYALTLARLHLVQGDIPKALEVVDGAIDDGEEFALEAILLRSHLYLLSSQNGPARADAIRASNLYPDEAFAFVQLAHVQLTEGKLTLAKKAAERAVLLDPSLSDAYMVRGAARQMAGDAEEAKEDFQRASRAPVELPVFLLGPAHELAEGSAMGLDASLLEMLGQQSGFGGIDPSMFAQFFNQGGDDGDGPSGMPGGMPGGMGGMNPMKMLDQIFDDSGNIRGPLKPVFEMAFKNAPKIMDNLPPGLLGSLDKEQLDQLDMSDLSTEEIEERMREFYQMMKSGQSPFDPDDDGESDR